MFYVERQISNFLFLYHISKPYFNRWDWREQHIKPRHVSTKWKRNLNEVSLFYLTNSWMVLSAMPKQNKQVDWTRWIINRLFLCCFIRFYILAQLPVYHFDVDGTTPSPRFRSLEINKTKCSPRHCAITLYKAVEISCHSFWWSCILRIMICEVMILVIPNDFRPCPHVLSGVNFLKTLKTAGCAGEGL